MVNSPSLSSPAAPAAAAAAPDRADSWRELNSYLLSAVCHLIAFVLLGLLTVAARHSADPFKLELQLGDSNDVFAGNEGALDGDEEFGEEAVESVAAVKLQQLFDFQAVATTESERAEVPLESLAAVEAPIDDQEVAKQVDRMLESKIGRGGGGLGEEGDRADAWSGRGSRAGVEKGFFGIGDAGKSFVYVVDCSDSMNERSKFRRAKYELMRSLEQLSSDQQYFVIFYSDGAYPMDAESTVAATEEEIARTGEWIDDVGASGGTNPLPALLIALSLQPDAIYFLSDGQFDPQIILELRGRNRDNRRLNQTQIPIHTIAFGDRRAEGLMKSISRNSGGRYRFVK
ncbi:MAG: vWA domain-containing protein [Pirellulales bacterium]